MSAIEIPLRETVLPKHSRLPALVVILFASLPLAAALVSIRQGWHALTVDSEGWGSMMFVGFFAPVAAGYTFLFALMPSVYLWRSKRRYGWGKEAFVVSCSVMVVILIVWLLFEPLRRFIIFHK